MRLLVVALALGLSCNTVVLAPAPTPMATPLERTYLPGVEQISWSGATSRTVAVMKVEALTSRPDAGIRVVVERVARVSSPRFTHEHEAGFLYVVAGAHTIRFGEREVHTGPGHAALIAPANQPHAHDIDAEQAWYFVSIRSAADWDRKVHPSGRYAHVSDELSPVATRTHPGGTFTVGYVLDFRVLRLEPGGRVPRHRTPGVESLLVLSGVAAVGVNRAWRDLPPDFGVTVGSGEVVEVENRTSSDVEILVLHVSPGGEVLLEELP